MDRIKLSKELFTKKAKDYTYAVLFFVIFSMFIFFAIRPSLTTATSLKKEEADLKKVDSIYESRIMEITTIQTQVEDNRDQLFLLDQAISEHPEVNKMVADVKAIADKNNIIIKKANIADVNLLQTKKTLDTVRLVVEGKVSFKDLSQFFADLMAQRRLKLIDKVLISHDIESSGSSQLKVTMTIDGFYL